MIALKLFALWIVALTKPPIGIPLFAAFVALNWRDVRKFAREVSPGSGLAVVVLCLVTLARLVYEDADGLVGAWKAYPNQFHPGVIGRVSGANLAILVIADQIAIWQLGLPRPTLRYAVRIGAVAAAVVAPLVGAVPAGPPYALAPLVALVATDAPALALVVSAALVAVGTHVGGADGLAVAYVGAAVPLVAEWPRGDSLNFLSDAVVAAIGIVLSGLVIAVSVGDPSELIPSKSLWAGDIEHLWYCAQLGSSKYDPAFWPPGSGLGCAYPPYVYALFEHAPLGAAQVVGKVVSLGALWGLSCALRPAGRRLSLIPFVYLPVLMCFRLDNPSIVIAAVAAWALREQRE